MASETHSNPAEAVATLERLYAAESGRLRDQFNAFASGADLRERARGYYPFLRVAIGAARLNIATLYHLSANTGRITDCSLHSEEPSIKIAPVDHLIDDSLFVAGFDPARIYPDDYDISLVLLVLKLGEQ